MFSHRCCSCEEAEITGSALKVENKKPGGVRGRGGEGLPWNHRYILMNKGTRLEEGKRNVPAGGGGSVLWLDLIMLFMKAREET